MAPPAASQGQGTSKPKHSPPGDLTKFITKHESDRIVDSGGHASIYRCTYMPREGQPVEVCSTSFITSYQYMTWLFLGGSQGASPTT
ncbi:hypothetical protein M405DRAFT_833090 [Rhizopogon salebrosus TDB-379]|nr:hypothetical protein M405DRAFT_833090 [Rhizopogon salebrosus TDB-379]